MELAAPEGIGLDPAALERALALVGRFAASGAYAGAVALAGRRGQVAACRAFGAAVATGTAPVPMVPDTIFDLASVTKVTATLPSVLRLVDAGELLLDQSVGQILPAFGTDGDRREVTVRRLLSHSSGLPGWRGLYLDHRGPEQYLAAICSQELEYRPGSKVVYSDLGFMLLGEIVRHITGQRIDAFAAREVFGPLGMVDTGYRPGPELQQRIAATERGNGIEYGMCQERAAAFGRWRQHVIRGEANDGNCFYGLDGVAGHAGLFGTAADLWRYAQMWLGEGSYGGRRILSPAVVRLATTPQAPGRGLGWQIRPGEPELHPAGELLGRRTFGHTGFTGTSLFIDPDRALVAILLTNRLHPEPSTAMEHVRPAFHNAVAAAVVD